MIHRILVGSRYFFSSFSDFNPKDTDLVELVSSTAERHYKHLPINSQGEEIFQIRQYQSYKDCLYWDLYYKSPPAVGRYLVPEFCNAINFPFEALPQLQSLVDKIIDNSKIAYIKVIYESYLENGSITLTATQRLRAYEIYKQARPERYSQQFN